GSSTTYYYLTGDVANLTDNYTSLAFYMFTSGATPSTSSYYAASTLSTINSSKDMYAVSSVSSGTINGSWSNYSSSSSQSSGPGGMSMQDEGNTDKTEYSTKGIKAANEITISGGTIDIESYDDGLHTSYGNTLDSDLGTYGTGNITISGGSINITTKDDGIHAEQTLAISGGTVVVETAYEGIEGPAINISGGETTIYATDDGLNAGTSDYFSSAITISGGMVVARVGSGDTDTIDSNGTYTQTGGTVVSINDAGSSGTASVLDCDSTVKITGGTFAGFGNVESTPTVSNVSKTTVSASFSSGSYTLNYTESSTATTIATFTLSTSYSSIYFAGPSGSYTFLKGTSTVKTFSL
nr:carbohydrate-binding domain-containing protein [Acholeplasmatales bacterium]